MMQVQAILVAEEGHHLASSGNPLDEDRSISGVMHGPHGQLKLQAFKRWKTVTLVSALNKDRTWKPGEIEGIWRRYVMRHHPPEAKQLGGYSAGRKRSNKFPSHQW